MPAIDDTGVHLLRHARVYTLAERYGVPELKKLSSSKIHCIDSTARGEIEYARYVYAHTTNDDTKVRAPIASFWATRSHTLRSEAEDEFKSLCLEYPQFGYDVLSMFPFHDKCCASSSEARDSSLIDFGSARFGRQAEAREERQDASCYGQCSQESAPFEQCCWVSYIEAATGYYVRAGGRRSLYTVSQQHFGEFASWGTILDVFFFFNASSMLRKCGNRHVHGYLA